MRKPCLTLLAIILLLATIVLPACSARDPLNETVYVQTIYTWNGTAWNQVPSVAYGELYEDSTPGTDITIVTNGTYYQWVSGTAGLHYLTTSVTGDNITIDTGGGGIYSVAFHVAYSTAGNDKVAHWAVFKNGTKQPNIGCETKTKSATMTHSSGSGILALADGDRIDLRVTSDTDGETITVNHANLNIMMIAR